MSVTDLTPNESLLLAHLRDLQTGMAMRAQCQAVLRGAPLPAHWDVDRVVQYQSWADNHIALARRGIRLAKIRAGVLQVDPSEEEGDDPPPE